MARILSLDPGFRHMSYCLIDTTYAPELEGKLVPEILRWGTEEMDVKLRPTAADVIDAAATFILQRPWMYMECDVVAIEGQMRQNPKMQKLSAALHAILHTLGKLVGNPVVVYYVKPKAKFEYFPVATKPLLSATATKSQKYKHRKDTAVCMAREFLDKWNTVESAEKKEFFEECNWNPDMADSLTNGMAFARWKGFY